MVSLLWFVAVWAVLLHTGFGQRLDDAAFAGSEVVGPRIVDAHYEALVLITNGSLAAGCLALVVIGVLRSRPLLGVGAAACVGGAAVTTEVLKRVLPVRPDLNDVAVHSIDTDFPSGHATVSAVLAYAFVMVTPHRWRTPTAVAAAIWVAFQGAGVVAAGWHRPSDALAGYAVALGWAAATLVVLDALGHVRAHHEEPEVSEHATGAALVAAGSLLVGLAVAVIAGAEADFGWSGTAFPLTIAAIDVSAFAAMWWFHRMLRPWTLGLVPQSVTRRRSAPG